MKRKFAVILILSLCYFVTGCLSGTSSTLVNKTEQTSTVSSKPKLEVLDDMDDQDYRSSIEKSLRTYDSGNSALFETNGLKEKPKKNYTLMIYITGSNLESRYGAATKDILEMQESGIDLEKNNLLLYTGGSKRWIADIPTTKNSVIDLSEKEEMSYSAQTESSASMGSSATLSEFINFCTDYYPAEHYGLILWDHGGGPIWGYGSDELFSYDSLILEEMRSAMDNTIFAGEKKLDFVGFDACLMGTLENADLWKDYAKYLIGSEELEAGAGWDYSFLEVFNHEDDVRSVSEAVVNSYKSYYENQKSEYFNPDVTLSVMDLSKTEDTINAVNTLFDKMTEDVENGNYALLNRARENTKAFGLSSAKSKEDSYDIIDLMHLSENLAYLYPQETKQVKEAIEGMIVVQTSNVENAGGVAIYFPGNNSELVRIADQLYSDKKVFSETYRDLVNAYTEKWLNGKQIEWDLEIPDLSNDEITLQLTQEQMENYSSARYAVLEKTTSSGYTMKTMNIKIEPDENGILHVPTNPMLVAAESDLQTSPLLWSCYQQEVGKSENYYNARMTYLSSGHEFTDFTFTNLNMDVNENVDITIKNEPGKTETIIQDISSNSDSVWLSGKGSIDASNYNTITDITSRLSFAPSQYENGKIKPYYEWHPSEIQSDSLNFDNSFHFVMMPVSQFRGDFICQILVKDIMGKDHASEIIHLPMPEIEQAEEPVSNGKCVFTLFDDHAELNECSGYGKILEIPSTAGGKPVTVIGKRCIHGENETEKVIIPDNVDTICEYAFYGKDTIKEVVFGKNTKTIGMEAFMGCKSLEKVDYPISLEKIGRAAFMDCNLKNVTIPIGIKEIGPAPFANNSSLVKINIDKENQVYTSKDGVLFTKDGKHLVQYPCAKGNTYIVPQGTEIIGYGSFSESFIKEISFPNTLKRIENNAFFRCSDLMSLTLPDSLEYVGSYAFGDYIADQRETDAETDTSTQKDNSVCIETIQLGKNVNYIGKDAFTALANKEFVVNEENACFASINGFISNKAKDTILYVPMGVGNIIQIPDGITTLTDNIFSNLDAYSEFIIPDSVFRISKTAFPFEENMSEETFSIETVCYSKIHCTMGSAAEEYAQKYKLSYDHNINPEDMTYVLKSFENEEVAMLYRMYNNHAVLMSYVQAGENKSVKLPSEIDGVPVTELKFPDSDEMTDFDISGSCVELVVPSSVNMIDPEFMATYEMESITVENDNPSYISKDGVLFTKDMKKLVSYPSNAQNEEYTVPEGVEEILRYASMGRLYLRKITFPDSLISIRECAFALSCNLEYIEFEQGLKYIDSYAFMGCPNLKTLNLPEGLEMIGDMCVFDLSSITGPLILPKSLKYIGDFAFYSTGEKPYETDVIRLGPNVNLGYIPFWGLLYDSFEVDIDNPYYSESDGSLLSKNGKELIKVPSKCSGEYHVPNGVETIFFLAFFEGDNITDVYLPDSVFDVGVIMDKDEISGDYNYTIHCRPGTYAANQLDIEGVPWVEIEN